MRFSVFPCLSTKSLSDDFAASKKTSLTTTATATLNEKGNLSTETTSTATSSISASDEQSTSSSSISDQSTTATAVNPSTRSNKTKMNVNDISKVVVSSRPFAAGSDATVYYCQVYYGPVSIPSDSGATTPTTTTGSDHGAGVADPIVSTSAVPLGADSFAVLKINRAEEPDRGKRLVAPLLCAHPGPMTTAQICARADNEINIFKLLLPQQGVGVPRLLGLISPNTTPKSHCNKLILENGGTTLNTLAYEQPYAYLLWADDLNNSARTALKACHALGVAHGGLHADNLVVHWVIDAATPPASRGKENDPLVSPLSPRSTTGISDFEKLSMSSMSSDCQFKDDHKILTYAALASRNARGAYSYQQKPPGISVRVFIIDWSKAVTGATLPRKQKEIRDLEDILTTCKNYARQRD